MLILLEIAIEIGLQELFGVHVSYVLRRPYIRAPVALDRGATCGCHQLRLAMLNLSIVTLTIADLV